MDNPGCRDFVKAVLNQVAAQTNIPLFSDDIMKNFDKIGGFEYASITAGAYAWGSIGGGDARIQINSNSPIKPTSRDLSFVNGMLGIHETAHVAANKKTYGYSDRALGLAAYQVALAQKTEKNVPKPPDTFDTITNSYYWSNRLFYACRPAWQRK